jgi:hypothetical protein
MVHDDTAARARELADEERQKDILSFRHGGRQRRIAILVVGLAIYLAILSDVLAAAFWACIALFITAIAANEALSFLA